MTFGNRLKSLRLEKGVTQDQLAETINSSYGTKLNKGMISKWENDKEEASLSSAIYLSKYFDTTLDYMLALSDVKKTEQNSIQLKIIKLLYQLNDIGKQEAEKRIKELTFIPMYQKEANTIHLLNTSDSLYLKASRQRTDLKPEQITEAMKQHDDDIMNDPNF